MAQLSLTVVPSFCVPDIHQRRGTALLFVFADACALEVSLLCGIFLRQLLQWLRPVELTSAQYRGLALGVLALPLVYYLVGLYPGLGVTGVQRLRGRVYSTFVVFAVLIFWDYMVQNRWSRGVLLGTLGFALTLPPIAESMARCLLGRIGWFGDPVVILGAGRTGALLSRILRQTPELGLRPVAFLDDDRAKCGTCVEGVSVLGPLMLTQEFRGRLRTAVIAMPGLGRGRLTDLIESIGLPRVIVIPDLFGIQSLWAETRDFGGVLGLEVKNNLISPANRFLKRMVDYVLGVPLLLLSIPLLGFFAILIRAVSPGSPFYAQEREGMDGRSIRVWKLRTMYQNADQMLHRYLDENPEERVAWERFFKLKRDPRVLPVLGHFLRRTSLDELPQLWNVLRGEMSLVGPRPFPCYHQERFPPKFRALRCSVLPGLTGLWQTKARSDGDLIVQETLDTYYIRNWSLWMDLHILACTIRMVLMPNGAY